MYLLRLKNWVENVMDCEASKRSDKDVIPGGLIRDILDEIHKYAVKYFMLKGILTTARTEIIDNCLNGYFGHVCADTDESDSSEDESD
nr:expressed protein [Hymenolepis microstoma]